MWGAVDGGEEQSEMKEILLKRLEWGRKVKGRGDGGEENKRNEEGSEA
jgi:hypothetical protein